MKTDQPEILLQGEGLTKVFGFGKSKVAAVKDVNFAFRKKEIISLVGESGSGKTTLARMLLGLLKPSAGKFYFQGKTWNFSKYGSRKAFWQQVQAIFQDPFSSFNQFFKVEKVFMDCIRFRGLRPAREEAFEMMRQACGFVNLKFEELYNKYPFELSGGQMQRLMIARIFILNPKVLIADEPTSMIDACSRSTIMDMLLKLREENQIAIVFITHDLGLAYYISDRICIMEKGRIVEDRAARDVITHPEHAYTRKLLEDVPKLHEAWMA
jgi:peptide/nickel transport system ATP-binding protein